jgi:predicted DNA-binding protein (UPF0251 family)
MVDDIVFVHMHKKERTLPRPRKKRFCRRYRADRVYKPQGIPLKDLEVVELSLDQFEALRLCDVDNLDQTQAGEALGVSRGTVQRLLYGARQALTAAILDGKAFTINLKTSEDCHVGLSAHQRRCRRR